MACPDRRERIVAIAQHIHGEALGFQGIRDETSGLPVVFDYEDAHDRSFEECESSQGSTGAMAVITDMRGGRIGSRRWLRW